MVLGGNLAVVYVQSLQMSCPVFADVAREISISPRPEPTFTESVPIADTLQLSLISKFMDLSCTQCYPERLCHPSPPISSSDSLLKKGEMSGIGLVDLYWNNYG